jgi:hypothetical protein
MKHLWIAAFGAMSLWYFASSLAHAQPAAPGSSAPTCSVTRGSYEMCLSGRLHKCRDVRRRTRPDDCRFRRACVATSKAC